MMAESGEELKLVGEVTPRRPETRWFEQNPVQAPIWGTIPTDHSSPTGG